MYAYKIEETPKMIKELSAQPGAVERPQPQLAIKAEVPKKTRRRWRRSRAFGSSGSSWGLVRFGA